MAGSRWKDNILVEWRDWRFIFFLGGPMDVLEVCVEKRVWDLNVEGNVLERVAGIRKGDIKPQVVSIHVGWTKLLYQLGAWLWDWA